MSALTMFEPFRQLALSLPGRTAVNNERTKSDWTQKEFPAETILTAGGRASGFLYFRGTCSNRHGRRLDVTADAISSSDIVTLSLELR